MLAAQRCEDGFGAPLGPFPVVVGQQEQLRQMFEACLLVAALRQLAAAHVSQDAMAAQRKKITQCSMLAINHSVRSSSCDT